MSDEARNEPVEAGELVRRVGTGLSRYAEPARGKVRATGRLAGVSTVGPGVAVIMREVAGLERDDICSATIASATRGLDDTLAAIGRTGRITVTGNGEAGSSWIGRLRIEDVDTVNGKPVNEIEAEQRTTALAAAELSGAATTDSSATEPR